MIVKRFLAARAAHRDWADGYDVGTEDREHGRPRVVPESSSSSRVEGYRAGWDEVDTLDREARGGAR